MRRERMRAPSLRELRGSRDSSLGRHSHHRCVHAKDGSRKFLTSSEGAVRPTSASQRGAARCCSAAGS